MTGIGQLGFAAVQSLTGNAALDTAMVLLAEYLVYLVPLALGFLWFGSREEKFDSLFAFYGTVAGIALTYVIGIFYYHQPPHLQGFETILMNSPENAFPSQHTAATFSVVWPLLYRGRRNFAYLLLVGAALTGFARVYTGLHFPVDILGGVLSSLLAFGGLYFFEEQAGKASKLAVEIWEEAAEIFESMLKSV
jgi:undecaprenyl-diphosphatase